ncbi:MAG: hypothetical protein GX418_01010 [Clostridiales bacterium]|nr:hypothetical protein [Clostridiales bacterium]
MNTFRLRKNQWCTAVILLCWFWMNLWVALRYEPWRDVAQSWMIARKLSLPELFAQLKYEGHPCLWFLLLMPLAKLGLPYASVIVLSFGLTLLGLWLFLRRAPFSWPVKLAVVFSAAGMYYLPVVARSYALVPALLMLIYAGYPLRYSRPLPYAALLFLLCQVHVILCGLVGMLMLQWALGAPRAARRGESGPARLAAALLIMLAGVAFFGWQLEGAVDANQAVAIRDWTDLAYMRRELCTALGRGGWYLTTIQLYEQGNTAWLFLLLPTAVAAAALAVVWLLRAPRSACLMLAAFAWQTGVHTLVYSAHMQHMVTFLWAAVFCVMLAKDELALPPGGETRPADRRLARALAAVTAALCLLTFARAYPAMRDECSDSGVTSDSAAVAEYLQTELPKTAVVLIDNEDTAPAVAAYLPDGVLYNPFRHNGHLFSLHEETPGGWCATGDLDAEIALLRAGGRSGPFYLLVDWRTEAEALAMGDRSAVKLELIARFSHDSAFERFLLYRVTEPS